MRHRKWLLSTIIVLLSVCICFHIHAQPTQGGDQKALIPITAANAATLREVALLDPKSGAPIPNLVWSADSQTLYSGGKETNTVIAWDIGSGKEKFVIDAEYSAFAVSSDGVFIAVDSSSDLGGVTIYDTQIQSVKAFLHCSGGTLAIAFSPTNSRLLVVSTEGGNSLPPHLDFWIVKPRMQIDTTYAEPCKPDYQVRATEAVPFLQFNPGGQYLLYGTHLLDIVTLKETAIFKDVPAYAVSAAAYSPDGKLLATNRQDSHEVLIWRSLWGMQNNQPIASLDLRQDSTITALTISALTFSPNAQLLVVRGYGTLHGTDSSLAWVWDTENDKPIAILQGQKDGFLEGSVAFSPDGKQLAVADTVIHIYGVTQ